MYGRSCDVFLLLLYSIVGCRLFFSARFPAKLSHISGSGLHAESLCSAKSCRYVGSSHIVGFRRNTGSSHTVVILSDNNTGSGHIVVSDHNPVSVDSTVFGHIV